ncbi:outer membrane protein assembly factor BamB family protein [Thalassoroseus pseudoceratinae]|uniref:outer membrane protein assembly factor BamB family protein n=1 Tax=Thalassoroseus pseudoceratinae TaxID=2713176 RepID=UPI00141DD5AC|nr:PQQ-binding-like beta-propeller repeat protein [Thalassoroseus pseudoceratinae]
MANRFSDAELIELVQQKTPEELSLDEIEQLRTRLHDSPELQRTLIEQLHLESYLNTALGETRVSASEIVRRANAVTQPRQSWSRWLLWTGLATLVLGVGFFIWRDKNTDPPQIAQNDPTETTPLDAERENNGTTKSDLAANDGQISSDLQPIDVMLAASEAVETPNDNAGSPHDTEPKKNTDATIEIAESAPWYDGLNPAAKVQSVASASLIPPAWFRGESYFKSEANQWWKPVRGHGLRIDEREVHGIRTCEIQGLAKLQAPWVENAVLRVGLYNINQPRFHFWNGLEGVSICGYFKYNPKTWLAYHATRDAGKPQPNDLVLHDCDDGIHNRTEYGPVEFRWQAGELIMSRGDIRMVTIPMPQPPTEVYFEGNAHFSECAMYRGEPLPDRNSPRSSRLVEFTRPADWAWLSDQSPDGRNTLHELGQGRTEWQETIAAGVTVQTHADGNVSLSVEASEKLQTVAAAGPGREFREIVCRLGQIVPGTGITLVTDENVVVHRLAVLKDQKTGRLVLLPHHTYQKDTEIKLDSDTRFSPFIAEGQWLRIVPGFKSIAVETSRDGVHWGRAMHHPIRSISQRPTTVGLFVYPTEEPKQISLSHLEMRELNAIASLASTELRQQVPDWEWDASPNDSQWHRRVLMSRPAGTSLQDWRMACAIEFLQRHEWCELSSNLLRGVIDAGLSSEKSAEERVQLLNEVALLYDLWGSREAASIVRMYHRLAEILADEGHPSPFRTTLQALVTAPIWTEHDWDVADADFVRPRIIDSVFREQWPDVWASIREAQFWKTSANPNRNRVWESYDDHLLQWAETLAARNDASLDIEDRWSGRQRRRRRGGWLPPLVTQLSKEGYNVMAEFESAVRSEAWEDACRIVTSVDRGGMLGLLPDARDEQLLVSLPRAIALSMQEYPELGRKMKEEFEAVGRLRVREAITQDDAETIETATIRFYGTEAAAEAHRWLGDQALASGRFEQAVDAFQSGLKSATGDLERDLTDRLRLASSFLGNDFEEPVQGQVNLNETQLPASEFEALIAEVRSTHARSVEGGVDQSEATISVPPPSRYTARVLAEFSGNLGDGKPSSHNRIADMIGRQYAITVAGERIYVSNRFQVTAYNRTDGVEVWRQGVGKEQTSVNDWPGISMRPLVIGDRLFVRRLTKRGIELACLAIDTGKVIWTQRPDGQIVTDPIYQSGKLLAVVATVRQAGLVRLALTSFQPDTGEVLSRRTVLRLRDEWDSRPPCQLTSIDGKLVMTTSGTTVALDSLGNPHWLFQQSWLPRSAEKDRDRKYVQPPLLSGNALITVPPGARELVAIQAVNGRKLWSRPLPGIVRLIGSTDQSVIVQTEYGFEAFSNDDGRPLWKHDAQNILYGVLCDQSRLMFAKLLPIDQGMPCLVWLDLATGTETAHASLTALAGQADRVGPIVTDGDQLLALVGNGHEETSRRVVQLQPESGTVPGPLFPSELTQWLGNVVPQTQQATAQVLPGWTLLNEQSPKGRDEEPLFQSEVRGETDVLVTQMVKTPICFARSAPSNAKQFDIRVGHRSGEAWTLVVAADGKELLRVPVNDETAPDGWLSRTVDVTQLDDGVWLTLTQMSEGEQESRIAFWKHAKFQ